MQMYLVLGILAAAMVLFASEIIAIDMVAMLILLSLVLTGVLSPTEAVQGFANPAFITVGAMFVLSAGLLRTGALSAVARKILDLSGGKTHRLILLVMIQES